MNNREDVGPEAGVSPQVSTGSPRAIVTSALAQRVSSGLHLGLLSYGERLPSTRDIAREFSVDPRVALSAYQELEQRGIVEMRPRSGVFVAGPSDIGHSPSSGRYTWMVDILADAIDKGIPAIRFAEGVRRSLETLRLRVTVLECNDDQLFSVSNELENDYGLEATTVDLDSLDKGLAHDARHADCIVTTGSHSEVARTLGATLGVPTIVLSMCDDLFAEARRLLRQEAVYFVVVDRRFEAKLRHTFANDEGAENLRVMVVGRDDLSLIPHKSPAYLTRLTRKTLGSFPSLDRVIPENSVFSPSSARALLEFVVGANLTVLRSRSSTAATR